MNELSCKHCSRKLGRAEKNCPHCGQPLPADLEQYAHKKFISWFIILAIFCALIIYWLPPNWPSD